MYKQSINNIKTIIIPIDSLVFDLNQYRYKYYKELNNDLTLEQFNNAIGSIKSICDTLSVDINTVKNIENKIYNKFKLEYLKPKDGVMEVLHYAKTKNINIAVLSVYDKDYALSYLKKVHLDDKISYIVSPDHYISNLPSSDMITFVMDHFNNTKEEVLVLSSFNALTEAANKVEVNVIYVKDLIDYNNKSGGIYYNVADDLYAVLNLLLFEKYEEYDMFSNVLGMNSKMSKEELEHRKEALFDDFKDEGHVLSVINHTYGYHISQLNEHPVKEEAKVFAFNDDTDVKEEIKEEIKEEVKKETLAYSLSKEEGQELHNLISEIDHNEAEEIKEEPVESVKKKKRNLFIAFITGTCNTLIISLVLLMFGILFYLLFNKDLHSIPSLSIIPEVFNTYYQYIELTLTYILDLLHNINPYIMTYKQLISFANSYISTDLIKLTVIYIGNTVVLGIIRMIFYMLFKRKKDYVN